MKSQDGFSLIELLIVVVIIGIVAAIAIPNLIASRRFANEGAAISALRSIHSAEMTYQSSATGGGNFGTLANLAAANLIDSTLSSGSKSGYTFTAVNADATSTISASFAVVAKPIAANGASATGTRNFGISTEGIINFQAATGGTQMAAVVTNNVATFGAGTALSN